MDKVRILVINPGSTSSKIAVYENEETIFSESAEIPAAEIPELVNGLYPVEYIEQQCLLRAESIRTALGAAGIAADSFDVTVGRGGALIGAKAGAYEVTGEMKDFLYRYPAPWHPSNYGALLADIFAAESGCRAYIYDPSTVSELLDIAKITGYEGVYRTGGGHVLSHRACARRYARETNRDFDELRVIVAHLGGGCTFAAFENGRIADICNDLEGTYSPERGGAATPEEFMRYFISKNLKPEQVSGACRGSCGIMALLGTKDLREVERRIDQGDRRAKLVFDGMVYRVAKSIGGLAAAPLRGDVDAVIFTGGIAHSQRIVSQVSDYIRDMVREIVVYPGEEEMRALSEGAFRIYRGEESANDFNDIINYRPFTI